MKAWKQRNNDYGGIQLLRLHLVGRGGPSKCERMRTGGGGNADANVRL